MNPTHTTAARHPRTFFAATAALLTALTLTGCGTNDDPDQARKRPVIIQDSGADGFAGTLADPPFAIAPVTLRNTAGNQVRLGQVPAGKATAVFFGFTQCPDICPTTMADLATARRQLPPDLADRVALYFVTVDPKRDTPRVLQRWLEGFGPGVVGLRGSTALVNQAERSLYAVESTVDSSPTSDENESAHAHEDPPPETESSPHSHGGNGYEVNHSGSVYLFGPNGETLLYTGGYTANQYAADLTRLLDGPQ